LNLGGIAFASHKPTDEIVEEVEHLPNPAISGLRAQRDKVFGNAYGQVAEWQEWASRYASALLSDEPAQHHIDAWEWAESIVPGVSPETLVLAWNRGAAKSATFQGFCARWAFTLKRRFVLVIAETQEQAAKFVGAVAETLEANGIEPARNPLGASRGWRKDMIRTAQGFNLVAVGWDVATRGIRLGEMRPDVILVDDVDGRLDTKATTEKKKTVLTQTFIPAGAPGLAVGFGQNVILAGGLMDQLVKGTADFLTNRRVSYVQAVEGLRIDFQDKADGTRIPYIAEGVPTWKRLSIAVLNAFLAAMGVRAFLREYQHNVEEASGGLWDGTPVRYLADELADSTFPVPVNGNGLPTLNEIVVAVDPSGSRRGDEAGIVAAGSFTLPGGRKGVVVLEDLSDFLSPKQWAQESITLYRSLGAKKLLCERNFGGELVEDNLTGYPGAPPITMVTVSNGKIIRAEPIQQRYESGLVWHAKRLPGLEGQMLSWKPGSGLPSPGALDAMVIALSVLFGIADYVHPVKATPAYESAADLLIGSSAKSGQSGQGVAGNGLPVNPYSMFGG